MENTYSSIHLEEQTNHVDIFTFPHIKIGIITDGKFFHIPGTCYFTATMLKELHQAVEEYKA